MRRKAGRSGRSPVIIWISLFSWLMATIILWVALRAWGRLESYHSTALTAPMQSKGSTRLSNRTALVVVEGLGTEDIQRLPSLRWLAGAGGTWRINMPDAWWTPASWATLLTGANPREHSRLIPGQAGPLLADHLLAAATRSGQLAKVVAEPDFAGLVAGWSQPAPLADLPQLVQSGGPPLVLVHLNAFDEAGLRTVDRTLAEMIAAMDLGQSSLAVVGLGRPYQHPGIAPADPVLVAAGSTLLPGVNATADLRDITVTIADLTGLPTPAMAAGRSLLKEPLPVPAAKEQAKPWRERIQHWWASLPPGLPDRAKSAGPAALLLLLVVLGVLWQPVRWAALGQPLRWALITPPVYWLFAGQWPWDMLGPIHERFSTAWAWHLALPMAVASALVTAWAGLRLGSHRKAAWVRSALVLGTWATAALLCLAAATLAWLYGSDFAVALPPTPILWAYFALLWAGISVLAAVPIALPLAMMSAGWAAHRSALARDAAEANDQSVPPVSNRDNVVNLSSRRPPAE